ncbi:hypothetical protein A3K86_02780 [Photobacterium jeanii]|uniref:Uncharacterized protein n=1 Tax=Photobacterium jeanii TaxID=858640 RepID=A0A178KKL0_9GAMM|nr:hypothetical protein A3K86_02780 [Photobacterium jeanii]PST92473.1 hypothetical protein C9I91_04690 [Photobacterium jeanii]
MRLVRPLSNLREVATGIVVVSFAYSVKFVYELDYTQLIVNQVLIPWNGLIKESPECLICFIRMALMYVVLTQLVSLATRIGYKWLQKWYLSPIWIREAELSNALINTSIYFVTGIMIWLDYDVQLLRDFYLVIIPAVQSVIHCSR